ncbi:MAG: phosphate ABC transporter permease [Candidatus Omnitrophica bacterium CG11_big_fil_rev_8_21_14_0_20_64_10]|nr:MAG: phosphate ABC transporter permease [Candidatus Omnitrophica bacterium CG11_big_fil_rev_8_21_14_0_20_64_10]
MSTAEAALGAESAPVELRIESTSGKLRFNFRELWAYRELLGFLVWRDIQVRYKQTALGVFWAVLQPVLAMLVFTVFFGRLAQMPSDGIPYPVFSYTGLLPWQLFIYAVTQSGNSLVANQQLVKKVYFPRLLIPASAVLAGLVDFFIAFVILLGLMGFYGIVPTRAVVTLPLFLALAVGTALAVGFWLSALNVRYRDVRYTIPFLTQFWLFVTPIAYPSTLVPEKWRLLYGLNPMAGVVEGFRWALLGKQGPPDPLIFVSAAVVAVIGVGGLIYFRKMERTFADEV